MQAGKLDQRITLQKPILANVGGQLKETKYTTKCSVPAQVISQKGSEVWETNRQNARETIRVQIRYREDVTAQWRMIWNGITYNIVSPPDRSQRRKGELWFTAMAVGGKL